MKYHIFTNVTCYVRKFTDTVIIAEANRDNIVSLLPGRYKLRFESTKSRLDYIDIIKEVDGLTSEDFEEIDLISIQREREKYGKNVLSNSLSSQISDFYNKNDGLSKIGDNYFYPDGKLCFSTGIFTHCIGMNNFSNGLAVFRQVRPKEKYGFIDKGNNIVINAKFDNAESFINNLAIVKNGKYGLVRKSGRLAIPTIYDNISWDGANIIARQNGKVGILNYKNHVMVDFIYDAIYPTQSGLFLCRKDNKYGYLNSTYNEVIPFIFDELSLPSDGIICGIVDKMVTFLNLNGETISYFNLEIRDRAWVEYYGWPNSGNDFSHGLLTYTRNGKYGVIDSRNNIIVDFIYDYIDPLLGTDHYRVKMDDKYGIIDKSGRVKIPISYDEISPNCKYGIVGAKITDETGQYLRLLDLGNHILIEKKISDNYRLFDLYLCSFNVLKFQYEDLAKIERCAKIVDDDSIPWNERFMAKSYLNPGQYCGFFSEDNLLFTEFYCDDYSDYYLTLYANDVVIAMQGGSTSYCWLNGKSFAPYNANGVEVYNPNELIEIPIIDKSCGTY